MEYNRIVKKIFQIEDKKKILSIYIIGSRARNEQTILKDENGIELSDMEIIVLMKSIFNIERKLKKFIYNKQILCEYSKSHLVLIHNLRSPLMLNFKKHGKKIYGEEIRDLIIST
jgi:predicted nucleotidyltransferase